MQNKNITRNTDVINEQEHLNFSKILHAYFEQWKLFLISIVACLFIALIYIICISSEYKVVSTVVIKDNKKGQAGFDVTAFDNFGILTQSGNVDNETEILRSQSLMQSVMDSLGTNIIYYKKKGIGKTELYKSSPIRVYKSNLQEEGRFIIDKNDNNELYIESDERNFSKIVNPGEPFDSPWGKLIVTLTSGNEEGFPVYVSFLPAEKYPQVKINSLGKNSSAVELAIRTPNPSKGMDILNTLVDIYNLQVIQDKNFVAYSTLNFINQRLSDITNDLQGAEKEVENYKKHHNLTNPESEADLYLTVNAEREKKALEIDLQIDILNSIQTYLDSQDTKNNVVPINVGLTDPTIINVINTYNESIIEKIRITAGMKPDDPRLQEWERNMMSIRKTLLEGIELTKTSLLQTKDELMKQGMLYSAKIKTLSTQERESRELYRQKEIKESLFLYLTQKKVETELALELTTPTAKVIDRAYAGKRPVFPPKVLILFSALILGFLVPFLYLYLKVLFQNKVNSKDELLKFLEIPFLGEIPESKDKNPYPVLNFCSIIAERFRMAITGLSFINDSDQNKVLMITSTTGKEGKSFFSENLALSIAGSGKKTLLIDLNMRKPATIQLAAATKKGITSFLSDPTVNINEIIVPSSKNQNLDIIPMNELPINPGVLLTSDRLERLFREVRNLYEYIIVDTPPASLFADVYTISRFTDICIYIIRANYTHIESLSFIHDLYKNNKIQNMTYILNDVHQSGYKKNEYGGKNDDYFNEWEKFA